MTRCPHCQTVLDGASEPSGTAADDSEAVRYVLCPDCHSLVAGAN